jgi:hypothetical protein
LESLSSAQPVKSFQDAWNYCIEPGWMMWAMAKEELPFDDRLNKFAFDEVTSVYSLLSDTRSQDAYKILKSYLGGDVSANLKTALSEAQAVLTGPIGAKELSPAYRAAAALVDAIQCADGNNNIVQRTQAADRATAQALEARNWPATTSFSDWQAFWKKWRDQRTSQQAAVVRSWVNLNDPGVKKLIAKLELANQKPPADAVDANCTTAKRGGSIASPTSSPWHSSSINSGTAWVAYGTDNSTPLSRSASVTGSMSGGPQAGTYLAPPAGYQWSYKWANLTPGENAALTVTWTEQDGSMDSEGPINYTVGS